MRNLKRALSLALASVMLLGMMVVGTSAATFSDEAEIVNKEAVQITAGLGLFAGSDGKFNPAGNVTRAQMATVIVKMLYGSEINADQFKGAGKFTDTVSFEGGWAEGYINLCSSLGIVKGYGDNTFKPGNSVTTAEAVTMIINALKVDAGEGTWPLTVMAKAEEMKLFAELAVKPGTNEALTRDALASIVLEGLQYSPEGTTGYKVAGLTFVFDSFSDALTAALMSGKAATDITEVVGEDTLAKTVFDMVSVTGYVTGNQATGLDYTTVGDVDLALETGLDMIGHFVTAYYAEEYESEDEPGIAYCIVDEAKYVNVNASGVDSKKEYQSFFGNKAVAVSDAGVVVDGTYFTTPYATGLAAALTSYDETNWTAVQGTYAIYEGEIIAYIAPASTVMSKVTKVTTTAGKESITVNGVGLLSNTEDDDEVVEYDGIAKDDIVIVKNAQNTIYTLAKADKVEGKITRTSKNADGKNVITVNGTQYVEYGTNSAGSSGLEWDVTTVNFDSTYDIYVYGGKYIGFDETAAAAANVSDVIYVVDGYEIDGASDAYGNKSTNVYAQGVDMEGKEVSILVGIDYTDAGTADLGVTDGSLVASGFQTFKLSSVKDEKKANIMVGTPLMTKANPLYDADSDKVFGDTISGSLDSKTTRIRTDVENDLAFLNANTKFIVVDNTTIGSEMDIAVVTGTITETVTNAPVILSQDSRGNVTLEVVVIETASMNIVAEDYIYVSADQLTTKAVVGDGKIEYSVYFAEAGEEKVIAVDTDILAAGFYTYSYDATEGIYDLTAEGAGAHVFYNKVLENVNGNLLIAAGIEGEDASAAKIVDVRSDDALAESNVAEITTLEELADTLDIDGVTVTFDALTDEDDNVTNIYVTIVTEA